MELSKETIAALGKRCAEAKGSAYCPYSGFRVGAALLVDQAGDNGEEIIVPGCNVENASYGLCICAERTALVTAVARGFRKFKAVAVCGDKDDLWPCGACRQFIVEFGLDIAVLSFNVDGSHTQTSIAALLPHAFTPADLGK